MSLIVNVPEDQKIAIIEDVLSCSRMLYPLSARTVPIGPVFKRRGILAWALGLEPIVSHWSYVDRYGIPRSIYSDVMHMHIDAHESLQCALCGASYARRYKYGRMLCDGNDSAVNDHPYFICLNKEGEKVYEVGWVYRSSVCADRLTCRQYVQEYVLPMVMKRQLEREERERMIQKKLENARTAVKL